VVLKAFIDDSGSDGPQPPGRDGKTRGNIFTLAGFMSTAEQWEMFSDKWEVLSNEPPQTPDFKMVKAYRKGGPDSYRWKSVEERDEKIVRFTDIITAHAGYRLQMHMPWPDYLSIVKGQVPENIDSPYFLLFHNIIVCSANFMDLMQLDGTVDFIFDYQGKFGENALGEDENGDARAVNWHRIIRSLVPDRVKSRMGSTPIFRHDKDVLPLKAADLYAWQIRRYYDVQQPRGELEVNETLRSIYDMYGCESRIRGPHLEDFVISYKKGILSLNADLRHFVPKGKYQSYEDSNGRPVTSEAKLRKRDESSLRCFED